MEKGEGMKTRNLFSIITFVAICGLALSSRATILVNDTWNTGTYTDPAAPQYSEYGTDSNGSGDLQSAWFSGGSSAFGPSAGHLVMTNGGTSATHTTYFTPEGSEVTLANSGDQLKVTWVFTPQGVNTSNTSQGFLLGIADSPSAARLTGNAAPPAAVYQGYAMFMNMGNTLKNSNPFQLREWHTGLSSDWLAHSSNWDALGNGVASGVHGYDSGSTYTCVMTLTRNASSGLDIVSTMTGGTIGGSGSITFSFTDATPNSFSYDTFGLRPSTAGSTATTFDTTLFEVETSFPVAIPEPSTLLLAGMGLGLMIAAIRRRR